MPLSATDSAQPIQTGGPTKKAPPQKSLHLLRTIASLFILLLLTLAPRLSNWEAIFHDGGVFFVDADCYSRMTRAGMVFRGEAFSIRWHAFENYPHGIAPHTTGGLDWLIATVAQLIRPFTQNALDYAGAWIGPLLALITTLFLLWQLKGTSGLWMALLYFALSPALVHGTSLGRPDHQCLQIALITAFLVFRWKAFHQTPDRNSSILSGILLGLALWVSLYEPLIIAALFLLLELAFNHRRLLTRTRLYEMGALALTFAFFCLIDGFRWSPPPDTPLFREWSKQIAELRSFQVPLILTWSGWVGALAAGGLIYVAAVRRQYSLIAWSIAWIVLLALTLWQLRWIYFLAVVTSFLLLRGFEFIPWKQVRWVTFALLLAPIWQYWFIILHPPPEVAEHLAEQKEDMRLLRESALFLQKNSEPDAAILAPWWLSPALVYWSGLPAVAGSSHQSLPGTEATARFYIESNATIAQQIAVDRKVRWIIAYEPDRIFETAKPLILRPNTPNSMATILHTKTNLAPRYLRLAYINNYFRIYRVQ